MELQYLLFDASDEDDGGASFDAMASVAPARLPALLAEVGAVLAWAHAQFGPPHEEGEWHHDLQAVAEPDDRPLALAWTAGDGTVAIAGVGAARRITVTFTVSGSGRFADGLRAAFALED